MLKSISIMPPKKNAKLTEKWCWWCCHPIPASSTLLHMPIDYDEQQKQYVTIGQFCSLGCIKSYNNDNNINSVNKYNINMLITRYAQECTGSVLVEVPCAPPRQALVVFGGHMTIDEFRKNTDRIHMTLPPIQVITYDIEKHQHTSKQCVLQTGGLEDRCESAEDVFATQGKTAKVINNPLKIKNKHDKRPVVIDNVLGMFQQQQM